MPLRAAAKFCSFRAPSTSRRRNGYFWAGLLVLLAGLLSNVLFFVNVPGQRFASWLNLLLFVVAVVFFVMGLRRATAQPAVYRGKIAGWIFVVLSVLLLRFPGLGFSKPAMVRPFPARLLRS